MKLYIVSSVDHVVEHWTKALKKYHPVALKTINELNRPNEGIVFIQDLLLTEEDLEQFTQGECRLMVLSMIPEFISAQKLLAKGIMGYGNAMMHETHFHSAYQALDEGNVWLHPDFIARMISQIRDNQNTKEKSLAQLDSLSRREREVALMLGDGATHQAIADALDITVRTVKAHATSIYEKLQVKDRLALSILLHS